MMNSSVVSMLNKEHIRRQFDRSAHRYDRVAGMQAEIVADLLSFCKFANQEGGESIVDVGCGTGYGLQALSDCFPQAYLTGLDLAPSMLEVASERQASARFVLGDIESLPFNNGEFDVVWSSSAIQWCDIDKAVNELARVTKPGGRLAISTFSVGTLDEWRKLWMQEQNGQRFETVESIESAFVNAGLKGIEVKSKTYLQEFGSFRAAANSIRDLGAGNAETDRSQGLFGVGQYREIQARVEKLIERDGDFVLPYNVVFVVATKEI